MDIIRKYICPICKREYYSEDKARECLNKGTPEFLVQVGDKINFIDCKDTPVLYGQKFTDNEINLFTNKDYKYVSSDILSIINKIRDGGYIGILKTYEVVKTEVDNHIPVYYLGTNGCIEWSVRSFSNDCKFAYPIIIGNELMQKILDLYN